MALGYQGPSVKKGGRTGLTYQGEEIVLQKARGRPEDRKLPTKAGWYPEEKKIEAATVFAACTNVSQTADITGVAVTAIRKWRHEDWFINILEQVRQENDDRLDQKFNKIIEESLNQIEDRVVNGNQQFDQKTGAIIHVPVPLRELTQAHASVLDKRQLLRGKPTSRSETGNVGDKLKTLAEEFLKIAAANKRKPVTIDMEVVDDGNATSNREEQTAE